MNFISDLFEQKYDVIITPKIIIPSLHQNYYILRIIFFVGYEEFFVTIFIMFLGFYLNKIMNLK